MYFRTEWLTIIDKAADLRHTSGKRDTSTITLIVLHDTGSKRNELWASTIYWLSTNPASNVSAHRAIDYDGTIYKLVPDDVIANHVGYSRMGNNTDINPESLGIELRRREGDTIYPITQLHSAALQCVEWYGLYGPLAIVHHSWIDTHGKVDPRAFPRKVFFTSFYQELYNAMQTGGIK